MYKGGTTSYTDREDKEALRYVALGTREEREKVCARELKMQLGMSQHLQFTLKSRHAPADCSYEACGLSADFSMLAYTYEAAQNTSFVADIRTLLSETNLVDLWEHLDWLALMACSNHAMCKLEQSRVCLLPIEYSAE